MTSTLDPASTDHMLHRFATRRPGAFAVLTCVAYMLPLVGLALLEQEQTSSTTAILGMNVSMVLVPAALLTALGWWGTAGFTRRTTWRSLVPFLPLALLFVVPPVLSLVAGPGIGGHDPGVIAMVAVTALALTFGEEATFRGVVLQTLLLRGTKRAVLLSSGLYGAMYLVVWFGVASPINTIAGGLDPVLVGVQILLAVGTGISFAAAVVVTGNIWPLVVIHAPMYFVTPLQSGADDPTAAQGSDLVVGSLVLGGLAAVYGIWLLHRHQHRHAAQSQDGVLSQWAGGPSRTPSS